MVETTIPATASNAIRYFMSFILRWRQRSSDLSKISSSIFSSAAGVLRDLCGVARGWARYHEGHAAESVAGGIGMAENRMNWNGYSTVLDVPREETASLLAKVLGITSLGFLITALGVATAPEWSTFPGMIAVLVLVLAITFARKASPTLALGLFLTLTYFMGWEIGPLIHRYARSVGPAVVFQAAATTGLGMAVMGCVAYLFQINYRKIAGIGFAALLLLIIAGIASMFFHFMTPDTYSWLTLGIFTLLTVGDFARIRAGGDGRSAVSLALSIYLDAINIFMAVLQLMSGRRRD